MRARSVWHGRVGADIDPVWSVPVDAPAGSSAPQVAQAVAAATAIVWVATCQRYPGQVKVAARYNGRLTKVIDLRGGFAYPVVSVDAIRHIGAEDVVETWVQAEWRFDQPFTLVKQYNGSDACFPYQDLFRPVGYLGSWWIEATIGPDPPADVVRAASMLAKEILLAEIDPERCSLPDNVRSVTRQGTTIEFDRSEWSGVPLMKELTAEWPKGHGCSKVDFEFGRDPARRAEWVQVPLDQIPTN